MTAPIHYEDSDRPGDAVSIEQANRAEISKADALALATRALVHGFLLGLTFGWATALAAAALGAWWLG